MNKPEVLGLIARYSTIVNSKFTLSRGFDKYEWSLDFYTETGAKINYRTFFIHEVKEVSFNFDTMSAFIEFK